IEAEDLDVTGAAAAEEPNIGASSPARMDRDVDLEDQAADSKKASEHSNRRWIGKTRDARQFLDAAEGGIVIGALSAVGAGAATRTIDDGIGNVLVNFGHDLQDFGRGSVDVDLAAGSRR